MKEGKPVTVHVINETDTPEFVHWDSSKTPSKSPTTVTPQWSSSPINPV